MKRHLLWLALGILLCLPANARERLSGWCEQGNHTVTVGGLSSTESVQQSFPECTVTIFDSGTANISSIFSDNSGTVLANPFTADESGFWFFYADNARYDVRLSGGGLASPFTMGDFLLSDAFQGTQEAVTFSATPTFDASAADIFTITLTGNVTSSTISNPVVGKTITIVVTQDGTGGRTFAWPANVVLRTATFVVSDDASAVSSLTAYFNSTNWQEIGRTADEIGRDLVPVATGRNLGSPTARFDAFLEVVQVGNINSIRYIDGNKFAQTASGIQAAIDEVEALGGGIVVIPQGTIALSTTQLTITSDNVVLMAAGSGAAPGGGATILTSAITSTAAIDISGKNVCLMGFTLDGLDTVGSAVGVLFQNSATSPGGYPCMRDMRVEDFASHGIHLDSTTGPGNLDFASFDNVRSRSNGGDGIKCEGADCNSGTFTMIDVGENDGWGFNMEGDGNFVAALHANQTATSDQNLRIAGDHNHIKIWSENDSVGGEITVVSGGDKNTTEVLSPILDHTTEIVDGGLQNQWIVDGRIGIGGVPASNDLLHVAENQTDTEPQIRIEQAGTGDAAIRFRIVGANSWSCGIDNSDSDKYKCAPGASVDTSPAYEVTVGGRFKTVGGDFVLKDFATLTAADTTPTVFDGNLFKTNSVAGITAFTDGVQGQMITVVCASADATTTIIDGSNLKLSSTFSCTGDDAIQLVYDGTDWFEISRSVN